LSSVYFDEENIGDFPASPLPSSPRATPGRGGEAAAHEPRHERVLSSVYFDEEETGEILLPPAAQEPRRERASLLLYPSLKSGDKAKPSHVASKGKRKEEPVEKRKCPRNTCAHSGPAPKDVMEEAAASLAVFVRPAKLSDAEQLIHLNQAFHYEMAQWETTVTLSQNEPSSEGKSEGKHSCYPVLDYHDLEFILTQEEPENLMVHGRRL
jgi:hypothetical protein